MMAYYLTTVTLLVQADSESDAADSISGLLTEKGVYDGNSLLDWRYESELALTDVPEEKQGREEFFS